MMREKKMAEAVPQDGSPRLDPQSGRSIRLALSGLECVHCAKRVRDALLSSHGVLGAEVHFAAGYADIRFDARAIGPLGLSRVVTRAGTGTGYHYRAVPARALFGTSGEKPVVA